MSSADKLLADILVVAKPGFDKAMAEIPAQFLSGLKDSLVGLNEGPVRYKVERHMKTAAYYAARAVQVTNPEIRADYNTGSKDEIMRALTVLKSEATAISNEQAANLMAAFGSALDAAAAIGGVILKAVVAGLVSGAIQGSTSDLPGV